MIRSKNTLHQIFAHPKYMKLVPINCLEAELAGLHVHEFKPGEDYQMSVQKNLRCINLSVSSSDNAMTSNAFEYPSHWLSSSCPQA